MSIWQKAYDWIKNIHTPNWLKVLLDELRNVIVACLLNIGREYLLKLEEKICEVQHMDISSDQKWQVVFDWGKANIPNIKDAGLNLAIEIFVNILKKRNFLKVVM